MKLHFELKKLKGKEGAIRAVLNQNGKKAVIYTGRKININQWEKGKAKPKNVGISQMLARYDSAYTKYVDLISASNELPSLTKAKDFLQQSVMSINSERGKKDIHALIEQYISEKKGFMKDGALKPYHTLSLHLADFKNNIQFADLNENFGDKFAKFLSEKSKKIKNSSDLQNPTINKMIVTLKVFCKWAHKQKHTSATDWRDIKRVKEIDQRIISLTLEELFTYFNFDFGNRVNLEEARDVFCFSALVGLRYNDLKQVSDKTVNNGYLHINTNKNDKELKIKLVDLAINILSKYNNTLPMKISNQKLNKNIKEGVKIAGIKRIETVITQYLANKSEKQVFVHDAISIHDARKTFVSICLNGGLSISEVMQMSTHNSYKSFARYVDIQQRKVDEKLPDVFSYLKVA